MGGLDYRPVSILVRVLAALCVLSACTQPTTSARPPDAPQSYVLALLPRDGAQTVITNEVQARLLREPPLSGKVASHGAGGSDLYSLKFEGNCGGNADLVEAVRQIALAHGASETSCVSADIFSPGEPIVFKRAPLAAPR